MVSHCIPVYLSNPATCCVVYRAYRAAKWCLAPLLTHKDPQDCIRVSENTPSRQLGE